MARPHSELMVSVSGIRGIVGDTFTPGVVPRFVTGFGRDLAPGSHVVIGRDSRTSGPWIEDLAAAQQRAMGHNVTVIGLCATPTVGYAIRSCGADGGIMVTASHNPVQWNALKFLGADGGFIRPAVARRVFAAARSSEPPPCADYRHVGRRLDDPGLAETHLSAVERLIQPRRRRRFHVVLDTVNGAGSVLLPRYLKGQGCRVTQINGEPTGLFSHPPEPLPANLRQLGRAVRAQGAHFGVAVDPDADRLAFVDERGRPLGEELSLGLAVAFVLSWRPGPVVVNLSTSRVCEDLARASGQRFYRTPVGEAHVAQKMSSVGAHIGGEGNGGVIYPLLHPGRDALVGLALVLELLRRESKPLSAVAAALPQWVLVKTSAPRPRDYEARLKKFLAALPAGRVDRRDGIRVDWPHGWIHMRKSNTEPIVRILAEARTARAARTLIDDVHRRLKL